MVIVFWCALQILGSGIATLVTLRRKDKLMVGDAAFDWHHILTYTAIDLGLSACKINCSNDRNIVLFAQ